MKLSSLTIGQYYPSESPVHRLDPRLKITAVLIYAIILFMVRNFTSFAIVAIFILGLIWLARLPWQWVFRGLKPLVYILTFTLALHLFTTAGPTWFEMGPLKVTRAGFLTGTFVCIRLILLVLGTSFISLTTTPIELTDGLEYLLSPLKVIKVPAHELAMMMTIALRFVPTLLSEADKIIKAQSSRGADFESGNVFKRAKNFIPLLVPLFVSVFRRADELALAMESRCYRGGEGRTRLNELKMRGIDWVALGVILVFLVGVVVVGRM